MAGWTYSAWRSEATAAARLTMLRQHMTEVSDKIGNERGAESWSVGSQSLTDYYKTLVEEERRLAGSAGVASNGGFMVARLIRTRDAR